MYIFNPELNLVMSCFCTNYWVAGAQGRHGLMLDRRHHLNRETSKIRTPNLAGYNAIALSQCLRGVDE
jgi:hypothetical protein